MPLYDGTAFGYTLCVTLKLVSMSSGLFGFNDSCRLSSKAGAMEFAIVMNTNHDAENRVCINYAEAKKLFDFICENVSLPEVPMSSGEALIDGYNGLLSTLVKHIDKEKG